MPTQAKTPTLTVGELTQAIASLLEGSFAFVRVVGEVSNLRQPRSGHIYFTLKDDQAQLKAVLFRMQQRYLERPLEDGQQVLCQGRIGVYAPRGDYQLLVDYAEPHGAGRLQQAFERLKARLAAEGLFEQERKKPLLPLPTHITLVTSATGAAVHDFIRVASRRYPLVTLAIFPVPVQGEGAAGRMVHALQTIEKQVNTDVIVLCRGGGSLEDLWAFNDEQLARTIANLDIPVVSAVGHAIDFTIADFVADLRAPTPSAAAELLLPDRQALIDRVQTARDRLRRTLQARLARAQASLLLQEQRLIRLGHPVTTQLLRVDHLRARLEQTVAIRLGQAGNRLELLRSRLEQISPRTAVQLYMQKVNQLELRIIVSCRQSINRKEQELGRQLVRLESMSPLATLARGYAIVRSKRPQRVITRADQVRPGQQLHILLHRGELECRVDRVSPPGTVAAATPPGKQTNRGN